MASAVGNQSFDEWRYAGSIGVLYERVCKDGKSTNRVTRIDTETFYLKRDKNPVIIGENYSCYDRYEDSFLGHALINSGEIVVYTDNCYALKREKLIEQAGIALLVHELVCSSKEIATILPPTPEVFKQITELQLPILQKSYTINGLKNRVIVKIPYDKLQDVLDKIFLVRGAEDQITFNGKSFKEFFNTAG